MQKLNPTFIKPRYDSGGFAGIPNRITNAFASGNYDSVVLFLIDGFGWRFFERFQDAPFIQRIAQHGKIEKLTSQFPSTTAAHVTTIHTGLPVGVSGVHEWHYYEPQLDMVITPLLFSQAGTKERDTLKRKKAQPEAIYPRGILYPELRRMGVTPYVFGSREHTPSTYSNVVMDGAEQRPFKTLTEAFINIGLLLEKQTAPTYVHLYFDKFDALCHEYGPTSPQAEAVEADVATSADIVVQLAGQVGIAAVHAARAAAVDVTAAIAVAQLVRKRDAASRRALCAIAFTWDGEEDQRPA